MAAHPRSLRETFFRFYRLTHERLLTAAGEISPEQFTWSAGPSLHSVAWHLWHAARWDDVLASYFHRALAQEPRRQVWDRESLADRWSLTAGSMGRRDTSTQMSDEAAEEMQFPAQNEVIAYARLAFAYADEAIELIPDDLLLAVAKDDHPLPDQFGRPFSHHRPNTMPAPAAIKCQICGIHTAGAAAQADLHPKEVASTMIEHRDVRHLMPWEGRAFRGRGNIIVFKVTGVDTGGAYSMGEVWVDPGARVPPHIENLYDELLMVAGGDVQS